MAEESDNPSSSGSDPETGTSGKPEEGARMRRRAFFTEGLRNLLKPVADLLEERIDHARRSVEASRRAAEGSAAAYSEGFTPGGY